MDIFFDKQKYYNYYMRKEEGRAACDVPLVQIPE